MRIYKCLKQIFYAPDQGFDGYHASMRRILVSVAMLVVLLALSMMAHIRWGSPPHCNASLATSVGLYQLKRSPSAHAFSIDLINGADTHIRTVLHPNSWNRIAFATFTPVSINRSFPSFGFVVNIDIHTSIDPVYHYFISAVAVDRLQAAIQSSIQLDATMPKKFYPCVLSIFFLLLACRTARSHSLLCSRNFLGPQSISTIFA